LVQIHFRYNSRVPIIIYIILQVKGTTANGYASQMRNTSAYTKRDAVTLCYTDVGGGVRLLFAGIFTTLSMPITIYYNILPITIGCFTHQISDFHFLPVHTVHTHSPDPPSTITHDGCIWFSARYECYTRKIMK